MKTLLAFMGVLLIFEGAPWFLSPRRVRLLLDQLAGLSDGTLRVFGLSCMLVGLLLVFLATG